MFIIILGSGVIYGGFYSKYGNETNKLIYNTLEIFQDIVIVRTSMQYQSVISAIPNINSNKNLSLMKNIFNENRYRLCVLIGGNCKKSFDGSISRFNWEQVHLYHYNDIAGMSPGFLAFSMIIFPFP